MAGKNQDCLIRGRAIIDSTLRLILWVMVAQCMKTEMLLVDQGGLKRLGTSRNPVSLELNAQAHHRLEQAGTALARLLRICQAMREHEVGPDPASGMAVDTDLTRGTNTSQDTDIGTGIGMSPAVGVRREMLEAAALTTPMHHSKTLDSTAALGLVPDPLTVVKKPVQKRRSHSRTASCTNVSVSLAQRQQARSRKRTTKQR